MRQEGATMVDVLRATVGLHEQGRAAGPQNGQVELAHGSYTTVCRRICGLAQVYIGARRRNGRR